MKELKSQNSRLKAKSTKLEKRMKQDTELIGNRRRNDSSKEDTFDGFEDEPAMKRQRTDVSIEEADQQRHAMTIYNAMMSKSLQR